jgi:hypothetical protein
MDQCLLWWLGVAADDEDSKLGFSQNTFAGPV